jgi:hypothetical protein
LFIFFLPKYRQRHKFNTPEQTLSDSL